MLKHRVTHPGTGDAADKFQKLVDERAEQTRDEYIVPFPLIDAPEKEDGYDEKHRLVTYLGNQLEYKIEDGVIKLCKKM